MYESAEERGVRQVTAKNLQARERRLQAAIGTTYIDRLGFGGAANGTGGGVRHIARLRLTSGSREP